MKFRNQNGFTLIEVVVAVAIFLLFALGIYGGATMIFKVVYQSRMTIMETAILDEELETVRNMPYDSVGTSGGAPSGVLSATKIVARDGASFTVTTTVKNVDDLYDGLAPTDTAPADYKLVEMSVICNGCLQARALAASTSVAPRGLEGGSQNGALFIHVFDANGQDVEGASVHIYNTIANPDILVDDVTDSEGMYRLINTATGTLSYNISVTKAGFSRDYTISSTSTGDSDPTKLPASVIEQTTTEVNFAIDELADLTLHSVNSSCSAIGSRTFIMTGDKLLATNPNIYKFDKTFTTDSQGNYHFANLEWDIYQLAISGSSYDIAGSTPILPFNITPGLVQDATVVLVAHTSNSLLVKVKDAGTGLPLSNATVELAGDSYDQTILTGLGYARQTDWSEGDGQIMFTDDDEYFSDSGGVDTNSPKGDVKLKKSGHYYVGSGWLESSTFDLGSLVNFNNVIWDPLSQPSQVGGNSVQIQIATSPSSSPASWTFTGPDGLSSSYYTTTSTIIYSGNNGKRYLRYRLFLKTANTSYTPDFSEVAFTYTASCTPPGQAFFSGLDDGAYTLTVSHDGYTTNVGQVEVSGNNDIEVNLSGS